MKLVRINDGQLLDADDLTEIGTNGLNFWAFMLRQLFDAGEYDSSNPVTGLGPDDAATVRGATDVSSATVPTYGFFGDGFRVVKVDVTSARMHFGWGLQFAASGFPSDESPVRLLHLGADTVFTVPAASAGNFRRDLILAKWQDQSIFASVPVMDDAGNVSDVSLATRRTPEVNTTSPTIQRVEGTEAATALAATRPAITVDYVALAEILVDDTGIANASNPDSVTPGIVDLRPRLFPRKAAGFSSPRRATCSMDEAAAQRAVMRWGAKAVGEEIVFGVGQLHATHPAAAAITVLDTSRDWRDMEIDVEFTALGTSDQIPGGASDYAFRFASHPGGSPASATLAQVVWNSGTGSADGSSDFVAPPSRTPADSSDATLTFYVDSTTGALCAYGKAGVALTTYFGFRAIGRGPLGFHSPTGVES